MPKAVDISGFSGRIEQIERTVVQCVRRLQDFAIKARIHEIPAQRRFAVKEKLEVETLS